MNAVEIAEFRRRQVSRSSAVDLSLQRSIHAVACGQLVPGSLELLLIELAGEQGFLLLALHLASIRCRCFRLCGWGFGLRLRSNRRSLRCLYRLRWRWLLLRCGRGFGWLGYSFLCRRLTFGLFLRLRMVRLCLFLILAAVALLFSHTNCRMNLREPCAQLSFF